MRELLLLVALIAACKRGGQQQGPQQGEGVPVTVAQVEKKTVPQQVKHRSAKAKAPRSGGPKECHGILPMRGLSHRPVQRIGVITSKPIIGGLHHHYIRI